MQFKTVEALVKDQLIRSVSPLDTVYDASIAMTDTNSRALPVVVASHLVGIISEKDIIQKCIAKGLDPKSTEINSVMTTHVQTIEADASIATAIRIMSEGKFHHLPVMEGNIKLIGMICSDNIPDEYRMLHDYFFTGEDHKTTLTKTPN